MPSRAVVLPGPAGALEAILAESESAPRALAVVCHPHPLHQGTMHNKVTVTLGRSFEILGTTTLRFNFRGVGGSAGQHGDGVGELADATAAVVWLRERWPGLPLHLAGFSFGAMIAIRIAADLAVRSLISVAPPVDRLVPPPSLPKCPWLIVQGGRDDVVAPNAVRRWAAAFDPTPSVVLLSEADHYFHGRLKELAASTRDFLLSFGEFAEAGAHAQSAR
jgi:alpha/beta superfamily hydrolase